MRRDDQTRGDMALRWASGRGTLTKGAGMVVAPLFVSLASAFAVPAFVVALLSILIESSGGQDLSALGLYLLVIVTVWTTNAFGEEMINRAAHQRPPQTAK
ncbi:MAG: hypothetical protein AAGB16_02930 [Pseudomonadota bacterium]